MNLEETAEFAKKIKYARTDIDKLNNAISSHPYGDKQRDIFYKISASIDYNPYIQMLKKARKLSGNMTFESLKYNMQRIVLIMLRDAVQLFIEAEEANEVVKEITNNK